MVDSEILERRISFIDKWHILDPNNILDPNVCDSYYNNGRTLRKAILNQLNFPKKSGDYFVQLDYSFMVKRRHYAVLNYSASEKVFISTYPVCNIRLDFIKKWIPLNEVLKEIGEF